MKKISTVLLVIGMTFLTSCTGENSEKSYVENPDNIVTGLPDSTVKIDLPEESGTEANETEEKAAAINETEIDPDSEEVLISQIIVPDVEALHVPQDFTYEDAYARKIARGGNYYYLDDSNRLWGMGSSNYGQLGMIDPINDGIIYHTEPVLIAEHVIHVDYSGEYFLIYLTEDHKLYGLGGNPAGVLQAVTREDYTVERLNVLTEPVLLQTDVAYAKCGYSSILVLLNNGDVYLHGNYRYSMSENTYQKPQKIFENAKYLATYYQSFAVILEDDSLWTFGLNDFGQCGTGERSAPVNPPVKVMDQVLCVWITTIGFNVEPEENDQSMNPILQYENMVVLTKDGEFYACGEGIGYETLLKDRDMQSIEYTRPTSAELIPVILCNE